MSPGIDFVHRLEDGPRAPVAPGSWVVASDRELTRPMELAVVVDGPEYTHADGHALAEVWELHDGTRRPGAELVPVDLADLITAGAETLRALRLCRFQPEADILRVHRAACLASRVRSPPSWMAGVLDSLLALDRAIAEADAAARHCARVRLPNLATALAAAGALELARSPGWVPGDPEHPHPRWQDETTKGKQ